MSHILVVEDDRDIAELMSMYLARAGHTTELLASGASAVRRVGVVRPDLVILDLMLPGQDGRSICRAMRADPDTAEVPIIMLTARGEEADRIVGLELGADDYVTKPFSPKELVARVARAAAPDAARRPAPGRIAAIRIAARSTSTARRHRRRAATCKLTAKEFLLLQYLVSTAAACCRAICCSPTCGATSTPAARAPSTSTSAGCARSCRCWATRIATVKQFGYKLARPRSPVER